jgi:DNA invertase Pin-like site-specific DNA recombinase
VNPDHLFLGTNADNIADRVAKGRSNKERPDVRGDNNWTRRHPEKVKRGEGVGTSAYSADQVRRVIELRLTGNFPTDISTKTGVSVAAIENILSRKSWRHISEPYTDQLAATIKPPRRTLTEADARNIRARLQGGETGRALAREFGVHFCTISDIKTGKIWKGV